MQEKTEPVTVSTSAIEHAAIVGGGFMGSGIAESVAVAGLPVVVCEMSFPLSLNNLIVTYGNPNSLQSCLPLPFVSRYFVPAIVRLFCPLLQLGSTLAGVFCTLL